MKVEERARLVERFRAGPDDLEVSLKGLPEEAYDHLPPVADAWSIRSQVRHLLDADLAAWGRIRKAVAEPGARVEVWDEEAWQAKLDYASCDVRRTLELFRAVRDEASDYLASLSPGAWEAASIEHPVRGRLTLEQVVVIYADHVPFHVELIARNARSFSGKKAR